MTDQVSEETVEQQPVEDMSDAMQPETAEEPETLEATDEQPEEADWEEIDWDGDQYRVPKVLKEAFMRHSDYTNKTKEVAEQRKQLEEQAQAFQQNSQIQQENLQAYAHMAALDAQLQQYQSIDWNKYFEDDPVQASQASFQFQQLKEQRQAIGQHITQRQQQALQMQSEQRTKRLEQGQAELKRSIQGWNQEMAADITKAGQDVYGYSETEMRSVDDPRHVRVLHDAMMYQRMMKKATAPAKTPVEPVKSVKGKSQVAKDPDKMTTAEWLKWRNKQLGA